MTPKISVLMPVYNGEKYIRETIQSVLDQTCADFEFFIIDDGSTDTTKEIISGFSDERIILFESAHGGIVQALNIGLEKSQGQYIVRIDADDVCVPHRFATLLAYMEEHSNVLVCGSWATKINEDGEMRGRLKHPPVEDAAIRKYAILHNPFIHPSVIMRKEVIERVGGYRGFKHNEDYELWTRILKVGRGHNIPEQLILYRVHDNQVTRKANLHMRMVSIVVRILAVLRLSL